MRAVKLSDEYKSSMSEKLLRSFATDTLKAKRCSTDYLTALRVILGNQAMADIYGIEVDMNHSVTFASAQTMRTLIAQFDKAGFTCKRARVTSAIHSQVVTCYRGGSSWRVDAEQECIQRQRSHEDRAFATYMLTTGIALSDLPY